MGALAISTLLSCGKKAPKTSDDRLTVVATIGMIADIVRIVAGENATVDGIIGEGVDPHLYKPTANDLKSMSQADIVFYNGLHLEGKMGENLEKLAAKGKSVVAVAEALKKRADFLLQDDEEGVDPHVWMDASAWSLAVEEVITALSAADPANASTYSANGSDLIAKLNDLDAYAATAFKSIPQNQRILVTAHDAFGYMARAYGIEVHAIQGLSTESEAGLKDIEKLVAMLVERQIPSVFIESSVSDKNIRALIEGAAAQGHEVKVGGELFSDAMGKAGTYEGTYIGMIDHNVTTITNALGGEAAGFSKH